MDSPSKSLLSLQWEKKASKIKEEEAPKSPKKNRTADIFVTDIVSVLVVLTTPTFQSYFSSKTLNNPDKIVPY